MSTSVDSPIRFRLRCAKTHWLLHAEASSGASIWIKAGVSGADLVKVAFETPGQLLDLCAKWSANLKASTKQRSPPSTMSCRHARWLSTACRSRWPGGAQNSARKLVTAADAPSVLPDLREAMPNH